MSALQSMERVVDAIIASIKSGFDAAASDLRIDRNDGIVKTGGFQRFYISPKYSNFQSPACYVLCERSNYQPDVAQSNYVNGKTKVTVRAVIEEKDEEHLTRGVYRYEAILKKILDQSWIVVDQSVLTGGTGLVKLFIVVNESEYSNVFVPKNKPEGVFRQAVDLSLEVRHMESL